MFDLSGADQPERSDAHHDDGDIAIVGMACLFPGAKDLRSYWQNIVDKHSAISDPPAEWDADLYFDAASADNDRIYTQRGGFLGDLAVVHPLLHGIMPTSIDGGEPDQFLALEIAHRALSDAGLLTRPVPGDRVEIILGRGTYINRGFTNVVQHGIIVDRVLDILKALHPEHSDDEVLAIKQQLKATLPPFNPEMAPGLVPNLVTGRAANRLDIRGVNYIIDAACASSHIATDRGVEDLRAGRCDVAIVGGVHASTPAPIFMIFCQLAALSRRGEIRPFDKDADGTLLAEGLGILVLKRLADAEAADDRIYALIKGIGTASDGRGLGMLAPRIEGETLALQRAYERSGVAPRTIGLIEAHGTATLVGDATEVASLAAVLGPRQSLPPWCALGSVKSMIGHCLPAAGSAGLIKTALALYYKVLPPTLNCQDPNPDLGLDPTPLYINTETRPWVHGAPWPRRAGVNAFGFGGINAHAILEEYRGRSGRQVPPQLRRASEVLIIEAEGREALAERCGAIAGTLAMYADRPLAATAADLNLDRKDLPCRLAVVAKDPSDAAAKLAKAAKRLADPATKRIRERTGVFFTSEPLAATGTLAFLFPGEGSQYENMLADIAIHFPEVREWFDLIDRAFFGHPRGLLPSQVIFPPPLAAHERAEGDRGQAIWRMDVGPEAIFAANQAVRTLLSKLGIRPDAIVGHSTGEYSALVSAGANRYSDLDKLVDDIRALNSHYEEVVAAGFVPPGALITVAGVALEALSQVLAERDDVVLAMDNCPHQQVVCALTAEGADWLEHRLSAFGALTARLPFDRAYHTPAFAGFSEQLERFFSRLRIEAPEVPLYSCMTATVMPANAAEIRRLAMAQWSHRVRFRETIEQMYEDGVRLFVECGPRNNLTAFVNDILKGRPHLAVPTDIEFQDGITQLNSMIAQLAAHGVTLDLSLLYGEAGQAAETAAADADPTKKKGLRLKTGLQPLRLLSEAGLQMKPGPAPRTSSPCPAPDPAALPRPAAEPVVAPAAAAEPPFAGHVPLVAELASEPPLSVAAEAGARPPADAAAVVFDAYFEAMDQFLTVQQQVLAAYLTDGESEETGDAAGLVLDHEPDTAAASGACGYPLLGCVAIAADGNSLSAEAVVDVRKQLYLADHTIGRQISTQDPDLIALPVVPLTFSMELLAEAARALVPELVVVGMREVRAYRWISLDQGRLVLDLSATRLPGADGPSEVAVVVREVAAPDADPCRPRPPIIEGTILLAAHRPPPPPPLALLTGARPSRFKPEDVYDEIMFHGPRLQAIASMDLWSEDGSEGTFVGLDHSRLFDFTAAPHFETDAISLDNAGQLIGMWTADHLPHAFHVFPFRMEGLEIFGDNLAPGERARCRARIALIGEDQVRSDIDIVDAAGRVRNRLTGWWDRRFDLPDPFFRIRRDPVRVLMARILYEAAPADASGDDVAVTLVDGLPPDFLESSGEIWLKVLAHLVLGRAERPAWQAMAAGPFMRKADWLLGRTAAKDAARVLLARRGIAVAPADIEIGNNEAGRPMIGPLWQAAWGPPPHLSISHKGGIAAAIAAWPERVGGVGIDLERTQARSPAFAETAFSATERALIGAAADSDGTETRFWCAREAIGKAYGRGLADMLAEVTITGDAANRGGVRVSVPPHWRGAADTAAAAADEVATLALNDGMVLAVAIVRSPAQRAP